MRPTLGAYTWSRWLTRGRATLHGKEVQHEEACPRVAAASVLVLAGFAVAVAAASTPADVQTLASAESHVETLLHNYSNTPAWKSEYKAAVATQNGDIAKVNADLFPPATSTSLTWTTSGTLDTRPFFGQGNIHTELDDYA